MDDAFIWHEILDDYIKTRTSTIELGQKIETAMTNYLHSISDNAEFKVTFNHGTDIILECNNDPFTKEDIKGFTEVFGLKLLINNKLVIENHLENYTLTKTRYMFIINGEKKVEK